jgi:hypothetical protein
MRSNERLAASSIVKACPAFDDASPLGEKTNLHEGNNHLCRDLAYQRRVA